MSTVATVPVAKARPALGLSGSPIALQMEVSDQCAHSDSDSKHLLHPAEAVLAPHSPSERLGLDPKTAKLASGCHRYYLYYHYRYWHCSLEVRVRLQ